MAFVPLTWRGAEVAEFAQPALADPPSPRVSQRFALVSSLPPHHWPGRFSGLPVGPSPSALIYPDPGCQSSPGSRLPVFSLLAPFTSMMEKISTPPHAASVSCDKKQVLLNKADVNNR